VQRQWDDKSGFLRQCGFALANWNDLDLAIRALCDSVEAVDDGANEYGTFYRIDGALKGPTATLAVTLIWMRRSVDQRVYFVTLKPRKE
jgi:hypothetical protein